MFDCDITRSEVAGDDGAYYKDLIALRHSPLYSVNSGVMFGIISYR